MPLQLINPTLRLNVVIKVNRLLREYFNYKYAQTAIQN